MSNFQNLNLNPTIVATLENKGYVTPTPIQAQSIPHLLEGKDLLGIAQTGTGKTAAFSLPILDRLARDKKQLKANQFRVLILTPTRELATQISDNIALYGKGLGLRHAVIFGGVSELNQIKELKGGLDIVVATPGRLLDLANQGHVRFSQVEVFVLDEADRMLDMGFINDVRKIISKLPQERQSLLFSATMPDTISRLANSLLKHPVKVEITPQSTTVERINQKVYLVEKANKPALLLDVLVKSDVVAVLVFCKTKHGADKVVTYLQKYAVPVLAIHGNKSQTAREKSLKSLREGKIKVLVATDIAARGIDVSSISHVINYDIPVDPESYVHRIGRTARAGREGIAISFCDPLENLLLRAVEKTIRMKIPVDTSHSFHGKAATHDSGEGRLLSRRVGNNKPSSGEAQNNRSAENRRFGNGFSGDRNRSFKQRPEDRDYSKKKKFGGNRFKDNKAAEGGEPMVKKILRKFGFNKFNKSADESNSDFSRSDSKGRGRSFGDGGKGKSKSSNQKSSGGRSFFSSRKKPSHKSNKWK